MTAALWTFIERRPLLSLALAGLVSLAGYAVLFGAVLQKPLTLGDMMAAMGRKEAIARAAGPGKIVIAAGSNGRYSHSCAEISKRLSRPCANMAVAASIRPDLLFNSVLGELQPGDLVYVPLEYETWRRRGAAIADDDAAPWLFRNDRRRLWEMGPERLLWAAFSYDVRFAIQAVAEMGLQGLKVSRRSNLATLNDHGDETGATPQAALAYRRFVAEQAWRPPPPPEPGGAGEVLLADFVRKAKAKGARVVGGLPTTVADVPVSDEMALAVEGVFRRSGAEFVVLENRSQYPRSYFFDTVYHLQTPWQAAHSRAVAEALAGLAAPEGGRK